jgi:hypothetical protein
MPKQSRQVLLNLPNPLHTLILFAAFLMLVGVVLDASASLSRRPSFFNEVSHRAAARGFLPAGGFKGGLRLQLGWGVGGVKEPEE